MGSALEVDDDRVRRVRRVELELDGARELFVVAAQDLLTAAHDEPPDFGAGGGGRRDEQGGERQRPSRATGRRRAHRAV